MRAETVTMNIDADTFERYSSTLERLAWLEDNPRKTKERKNVLQTLSTEREGIRNEARRVRRTLEHLPESEDKKAIEHREQLEARLEFLTSLDLQSFELL